MKSQNLKNGGVGKNNRANKKNAATVAKIPKYSPQTPKNLYKKHQVNHLIILDESGSMAG